MPIPASSCVLAAQVAGRGIIDAQLAARPDTFSRSDIERSRISVATEPKPGIFDRARSGDPEAFATLFRQYGDDVVGVCRRMLGDMDAASDAQGEVFLKARRALDGYDSARPFRSWLLAIASNHCIDQLRRAATERRVFADTRIESGELGGSEPSPLSRLIARERRDALDHAIARLPIQYRLPLLLRYYSDASYDEIAESLGTTRSRVATLIFRAKRRLREEMTRSPAQADGQSSDPTTSAEEAQDRRGRK